jgi:hypothetical protein
VKEGEKMFLRCPLACQLDIFGNPIPPCQQRFLDPEILLPDIEKRFTEKLPEPQECAHCQHRHNWLPPYITY